MDEFFNSLIDQSQDAQIQQDVLFATFAYHAIDQLMN